MTALSICVTTYNRADLLRRLLESIEESCLSEIEIIITDDGSRDKTRSTVDEYRERSGATIRYIWQENAGRATALWNAIMSATGDYTIIMDSDDYFIAGGLKRILEEVQKLSENTGCSSSFCGIAFGVVLRRGDKDLLSLPPAIAYSNFIAIRADHGVSTDLKEVVRTRILQENLYVVPPGCRRVPTSSLWVRIADQYDCLCVPEPIAVKEYLDGGMTSNILSLKTKDALPVEAVFRKLSKSRRYKSKLYRLKANVQKHRFAFHCSMPRFEKYSDLFFMPAGLLIYMSDKLRLAAKALIRR